MAMNAFSNDGLSREWRWFVIWHYRARGLGAIMLRLVAWGAGAWPRWWTPIP
jgi:hypothetical protein